MTINELINKANTEAKENFDNPETNTCGGRASFNGIVCNSVARIRNGKFGFRNDFTKNGKIISKKTVKETAG